MPETNSPTPKSDLRKRVYKTVEVIESGDSFGIALDGRTLNTPGRSPLVVSSRSMADAVAQEWDGQKETIDPATMPLSKLLNTSIDRVAPRRDDIVTDLLRFVDADMLCYRAEGPETLVARQNAVWQPVLDWLAATHSIVLETGTGIMPLTQSEDVTAKLSQILSSYDNIKLTGVQAAASLTSSLSLGVALVEKRLSGAEVFAASQLDETWQMEKWGEDAEAENRRAQLEADILAVENFVSLTR